MECTDTPPGGETSQVTVRQGACQAPISSPEGIHPLQVLQTTKRTDRIVEGVSSPSDGARGPSPTPDTAVDSSRLRLVESAQVHDKEQPHQRQRASRSGVKHPPSTRSAPSVVPPAPGTCIRVGHLRHRELSLLCIHSEPCACKLCAWPAPKRHRL